MTKLSRAEVEEVVRVAREKGETPDLSGADLSEVDLGETILSEANLIKVNLRGANLFAADLREANLCGANLFGANLTWAKLSGANLSKTFLSGVDLIEMNLRGASLKEAELVNTNLREADLRGVDLSGALLNGVDLSGAHLNDANLSNVHLVATTFGNTDLSGVRGLETVRHIGPSTIGIDTLFVSNGQIPEVFLHGAGVPVDLISYLEKIRTPKCGYTREQLDEYIESGKKYLTIIHRSLHLLREKKAKYGLDVPLSIEHQIFDYETEQAKAEERLAEYSRLRTLYYSSVQR